MTDETLKSAEECFGVDGIKAEEIDEMRQLLAEQNKRE